MTLNEKIIDSVQKTTGLRCFEGEPIGDIYGRFAYFVTLQSSNRFGEVAIFFVERPVYNRLNPTRATEDCTQLAIRWLNGLYAYSGLKFQEVISRNSVRDDKGGYGVGMRVVLANETANGCGKIEFVDLVLTSDPLGAAQLSGAKKYIKGKTATAGATANHGFTFAKWTDGTSDVSTDNPYSFIINADTSLVASMTRNNYTLALSGDTGVDSTTGAGTYPYEQSVTATATVKHGFAFTNWTSGSTVISTDNPYTFSLLDDTALVANTGRANYTVTLTEDIQGSITTFTGAGSYPYEQSVTVGATAAYGFTFAKWTDGTSDVSTDNPYTFQLLDNTSLVAEVTRNNYILSLSGGTGVTSTTGGGSYPYEQTVTATAVLDSHYDFSNWTSGGTVVSSSNPYEFSLLADTALQANATPKSYNVLGVSNDPTMGSVSGGGTYTYGDTVTLTATPIGDYVFDNWTVDGVQVSTDNPYVLTASESVIVQGNFKVNEVIVTVTVNNPTMGSASGGGSYTPGTVVTVTATANTGYEFVNWTRGGNVVSSSSSYAFAALEDTTVQANFQQEQRVLKITAVDNGLQFHLNNTSYIGEWSKDGGTSWTYQSTCTLNSGETALCRYHSGNYSEFITPQKPYIVSSGKRYRLSGYLDGLMFPANYSGNRQLGSANNLWANDTNLYSVSGLKLNVGNVSNSYYETFSGCTSMVYGDCEFLNPVNQINVYYRTFYGCTSMVSAPKRIPIGDLSAWNGCMNFTFFSCTSLTDVSDMQIDFNNINFGSVSSGTTLSVPFSNVFQGCSSLIHGPKFGNESTVWTRPTLTTSTKYGFVFSQLFLNCTNLLDITFLPNIPTWIISMYNSSSRKWYDFYPFTFDVTSDNGTFYKHYNTPTPSLSGISIKNTWTVENYNQEP